MWSLKETKPKKKRRRKNSLLKKNSSFPLNMKAQLTENRQPSFSCQKKRKLSSSCFRGGMENFFLVPLSNFCVWTNSTSSSSSSSLPSCHHTATYALLLLLFFLLLKTSLMLLWMFFTTSFYYYVSLQSLCLYPWHSTKKTSVSVARKTIWTPNEKKSIAISSLFGLAIISLSNNTNGWSI